MEKIECNLKLKHEENGLKYKITDNLEPELYDYHMSLDSGNMDPQKGMKYILGLCSQQMGELEREVEEFDNRICELERLKNEKLDLIRKYAAIYSVIKGDGLHE